VQIWTKLLIKITKINAISILLLFKNIIRGFLILLKYIIIYKYDDMQIILIQPILSIVLIILA